MAEEPKKGKVTFDTDRTLAALMPNPNRYEAWDLRSHGLRVRISPKGIKVFNLVLSFQR